MHISLLAQSLRKLALVGGMLLDGYAVPPVHHGAVLIEGERIVAVGRAAEISVPPDYRVIDTRGHTMLPGLVDLHAHLMILGHGDYGRFFDWLAEEDELSIERIMEISAGQLVDAGITTAVDLGAPTEVSLRVRDRIASGEVRGPRLLVSGAWVARRRFGGFPEAAQHRIGSPEEAAETVDALALAGVDVIKAWAGLTAEDYRAIADAAHRHDLQVHAHLYDAVSIRNALDAGVDVLQHVGSAGTPRFDDELLQAIAVSGRPVVPTGAHRVWVFPATVAFPERLQDPRLRVDFPGVLYDEVQSSLEGFQRLRYFRTTNRQMGFGDASMSQWMETGAVIGMGTDSGTPMNFHTEALWRELKAFVDLGMSELDAIQGATRVNARILGRDDRIGTLEPGKLADILVVRGNPLESITVLDRVEIVVKAGEVVKGPADP